MIIPFHVAVTTANAFQGLLSTTSNSILNSMVSGASNTLAMFGLGAITNGLGNLNIVRIKGAADTACVLTLCINNGTNTYEVWRTYLSDTQYFGFDDNFTPLSKTVLPTDYLVVPQTNSYVPGFKLATAPGATVNIAGFIELANTPPLTLTALIT